MVWNSSQTSLPTNPTNMTLSPTCPEIRFPEGTGKGKIKNFKETSDKETVESTVDYKKK